MDTEFGLTNGACNTKYAPLAAFALCFQVRDTLQPLQMVRDESGKPDFSLADKLKQVLISILAGCEYICEVNTRLRSEAELARAWGFERYLEQSSLALALNRLSRTNLAELEQAVQTIWRQSSRSVEHDWRGLLRFDLDLTGLVCGKEAEESEKGYFSGKKTGMDAN
jgi:hypothetical protein